LRSCDKCPGGAACAGTNLAPVLLRVVDLYAGGKRDKFEILFALGDGDEELLETHTADVERACWTKAALSAIAEVLVRREADIKAGGEWQETVEETLATAKAAFSDFPWHLPDLVEQAPDLHAEVLERVTGAEFEATISKRAFAKLCKAVVYGYMK
jgi:hypothetical protein